MRSHSRALSYSPLISVLSRRSKSMITQLDCLHFVVVEPVEEAGPDSELQFISMRPCTQTVGRGSIAFSCGSSQQRTFFLRYFEAQVACWSIPYATCCFFPRCIRFGPENC